MLLEHVLSIIKLSIVVIEPEISGSLYSSSGYSSALGYIVSNDTTGVACSSELMLGLSPQSKRKWATIDVHGIRGLIRYLPRGSRIRSGVKGLMEVQAVQIYSLA